MVEFVAYMYVVEFAVELGFVFDVLLVVVFEVVLVEFVVVFVWLFVVVFVVVLLFSMTWFLNWLNAVIMLLPLESLANSPSQNPAFHPNSYLALLAQSFSTISATAPLVPASVDFPTTILFKLKPCWVISLTEVFTYDEFALINRSSYVV